MGKTQIHQFSISSASPSWLLKLLINLRAGLKSWAKSRRSPSFFEAQQCGYTTYKNVLMSSSSRLRYLWSISHSICSLIIFFWGINMFLRISTSSVWRAAFVIRFLIFMIFTIASCKIWNETNEYSTERLLKWTKEDRNRRLSRDFKSSRPFKKRKKFGSTEEKEKEKRRARKQQCLWISNWITSTKLSRGEKRIGRYIHRTARGLNITFPKFGDKVRQLCHLMNNLR